MHLIAADLVLQPDLNEHELISQLDRIATELSDNSDCYECMFARTGEDRIRVIAFFEHTADIDAYKSTVQTSLAAIDSDGMVTVQSIVTGPVIAGSVID